MRDPIRRVLLQSPSRSIEFDAVLRETHNRSSQVSEFPVEDGAPVSDHIRAMPVEVTIDVMATATPIDAEPDPERDRMVRAELEAMWAARELVDITLVGGAYTGMAIASVVEPIDDRTGLSYQATVVLREVRRANTRRVEIPPLPADQRNAAEEVDLGEVQGEEPTEAEQEGGARPSLAFQVAGGTDEAVGAAIRAPGNLFNNAMANIPLGGP